MAPNQKAFTTQLVKQIQDINGNPSLSASEKKEAIANLSGASREDMMDYLNANFRTGPGLAESLSKHVSEGRPVGAPKDSAVGKKVRKRLGI